MSDMLGRQWAYVEDHVAFSTSYTSAGADAARKADLEGSVAIRIENLLTAHVLPPDLDVAVGIIRNGRPQVWLSNVDRNYVFSRVLEEMSRSGLNK